MSRFKWWHFWAPGLALWLAGQATWLLGDRAALVRLVLVSVALVLFVAALVVSYRAHRPVREARRQEMARRRAYLKSFDRGRR